MAALLETKERQIAVATLPKPKDSDTGLQRFHFWRSSSWQLLRYGLVGSASTLVDLLVLNIQLWCFPTNNVWMLVVYNSVGYCGGGVTSFFCNKYWTFGRKQKITRKEVVRFIIILALEILYSNGLIWLIGKALQSVITNPTLWGNATKLLAVVGGSILSYTFMRCWIFAGGSKDQLNKRITLQ